MQFFEMNFPQVALFLMNYAPQWLLSLLQRMSYEQVWQAMGALILLAGVIVFRHGYYHFRQALGHTKFKGNWYTADQFQRLIQELGACQASCRLNHAANG